MSLGPGGVGMSKLCAVTKPGHRVNRVKDSLRALDLHVVLTPAFSVVNFDRHEELVAESQPNSPEFGR